MFKIITWLPLFFRLSFHDSSTSSWTPREWRHPSVLCLYLVGKKKEREEAERQNEGGRWAGGPHSCWSAWERNGPGFTSHTQPASAYVWACMWVHLLARECVYLCVTGRAHKERRIVSKQRTRKDNRERVIRQGRIKERVWVKKKHFINVRRGVMRRVTMYEGSTGEGEKNQKR